MWHHGSTRQELLCLEKMLRRAYEYGFRQFIVMQNTPFAQIRNTWKYEDAVHLRAATLRNLNEQEKHFRKINAEWKDANLAIFPTYSLLLHMYTHAEKDYGFQNTASPCMGCTNPNAHFWVDRLHPSSRTMHILARKFVQFVINGKRGSELFDGDEDVD